MKIVRFFYVEMNTRIRITRGNGSCGSMDVSSFMLVPDGPGLDPALLDMYMPETFLH